MYINKSKLYEAIDSQPELVGADYTERVWELLQMLMIEAEAQDHMRWGVHYPDTDGDEMAALQGFLESDILEMIPGLGYGPSTVLTGDKK